MASASFTWDVVSTGQFRYVAKGVYTSGPDKGDDCTIKWFKSGLVFEESFYEHDMAVMSTAQDIARAFNEEGLIDKSIYINDCQIYTVTRDVINHGNVGGKVLVEPWIDGFQKFNSNSGWADDSYQSMQALSHFSYHYSNGKYLLCDLQGGRYSDCYVLTDPVVLSNRQEFGPTDLGHTGISNFFYHHQCNDFCQDHWLLPKRVAPASKFPVYHGTTFMG